DAQNECALGCLATKARQRAPDRHENVLQQIVVIRHVVGVTPRESNEHLAMRAHDVLERRSGHARQPRSLGYSARSGAAGSTRVARVAGIHAAATATRPSANVAAMNTIGPARPTPATCY